MKTLELARFTVDPADVAAGLGPILTRGGRTSCTSGSR